MQWLGIGREGPVRGREARSNGRPARWAALTVAALGVVAGTWAAPAGAQDSLAGTPGDTRATAIGGNITSCPSGMPLLLAVDSDKSGSAGPVVATVSNEYLTVSTTNANGFVNPLNGSNLVAYVKGGPNYNIYTFFVGPDGAALSGLHAPYNGGGNVPTISHYLVCQQPNANPATAGPACALTAIIEGPPRQLQVTIQDQSSGVTSIQVTLLVNATVNVPTFPPGTTSSLVVTATKIDPTTGSQLGLRVTNAAGGVTDCDPIY